MVYMKQYHFINQVLVDYLIQKNILYVGDIKDIIKK